MEYRLSPKGPDSKLQYATSEKSNDGCWNLRHSSWEQLTSMCMQ